MNKQDILRFLEHSEIKVTRGTDYPNLLNLKYIPSASDVEAFKCRGIVVDEDRDYKVVSRPYDRFPNYGVYQWGPEFDWSSFQVLEKLDGTMIKLYFYNGEWQVGTTGTPDAVCGSPILFKKLFWDTFRIFNYKLPEEINYTYIFELCTSWNTVVINYEKPRLVLHGVRDINTGKYKQIEEYRKYGWEIAKSYDFSTSDSIIKNISQLDGTKSEGYVAIDQHFNRIKFKAPDYVEKHRKTSNISLKKAIELVIDGEYLETVLTFSHLKTIMDEAKARYDRLIVDLEFLKNETKDYKGAELNKIKNQFKYGVYAFEVKKYKSVKELVRQPFPRVKFIKWMLYNKE